MVSFFSCSVSADVDSHEGKERTFKEVMNSKGTVKCPETKKEIVLVNVYLWFP